MLETLALAVLATASQGSDETEVRRLVLDNGAIVLLKPIDNVKAVAIESVYRVGFLHEPQGATQMAHLVEHLMCRCATEHYAPGESFDLLSARGSVNAETLADFTHYDYQLPKADMELALKVEADRLRGLKIDEDVVRREAKNCYQETDYVENARASGMIKHAFMAFAQAWRHRADKALVRAGLEDIAPEKYAEFYRRHYRPDNLILAIVGDFDPEEALALVKKHVGAVPRSDVPALEPIDWSKALAEMTVTWDSKVSAVCIACAPPQDPADCALLSLWGNLLFQKLTMDAELRRLADAVFVSNQTWSVGVLPFFVYAAAKPGVDPRQLNDVLRDRLAKAVASEVNARECADLRFMASVLVRPPFLEAGFWKQQVNQAAARSGKSEEEAVDPMVGTAALQFALREATLAGCSPADLQSLKEASPQRMQDLVRRYLASDQQRVVFLRPASAAP